jgi:hypothetical protein
MDSDGITRLVIALVMIAAVVFDWPRALAGLAVGYAGQRSASPKLVTTAGVVAVSAIGEVIYPLIGRTAHMSGGSFMFGLIAAGITAFGLFRLLAILLDS